MDGLIAGSTFMEGMGGLVLALSGAGGAIAAVLLPPFALSPGVS